ncbi:HD family hydrolase [Streptomyces sp. NPDC127166]
MADDLSAVAHFLYEAGPLKNARRTGWWTAGIRDPKSVAEHSCRTSLIASVIARLEGADPARAALLVVWHDTQETRPGDVNYLGKKYTGSASADAQHVTADQTADMPDILASALREVVAEYEDKQSPEAACTRDADKLEYMLQGLECKAGNTRLGIQGPGLSERPTMDRQQPAKADHRHGKRLAEALLAQDPLEWLRTTLGENQASQTRPTRKRTELSSSSGQAVQAGRGLMEN